MLERNWEPGDHEIVLGWFEAELDRVARHSMQDALREFWTHHPDPGGELRMLHAQYEKGTCSFCRERTVQRLIELNSLPDTLRAECAHDASSEIRELVGAG